MNSSIPTPGGQIARRPLHFFWLVDHSGSMAGKKIATLNRAIPEALPAIQQAAGNHPEVVVLMRAIRFADDATWHVGPDPVELDKFCWPELTTAGGTATSRAITLLADQLTESQMPKRAFPPVCVLISDGCCTDPPEDYERAIKRLNDVPWGKRAVRLAIGVGQDDESGYSEEELLKFVSHPEIGVLKADSPDKLVQYIRWASVTATSAASVGKSKPADPGNNPYVVLPAPPVPSIGPGESGLDVF